MADRVARKLVVWEGPGVVVGGSFYFENRRFLIGPGDVLGIEGLLIEGNPDMQYRVVLYSGGTAQFIGDLLPVVELERVLHYSSRHCGKARRNDHPVPCLGLHGG
jgi:hypothetical protein